MKIAPLLLILCAGYASAQTSITRNYKVGDVEKYSFSMTATTSMGDIEQKSTMIQKVVKVYENGDADIETSTADVRMSFMGQEMDAPAGSTPTSTARVDKFGVPINGAKKGGMSIDASQFALLGLKDVADLVKGKEIPIDQTQGDGSVKGKATVLSIEDNLLKLASDLTITGKTGDPMKLKTISTIDITKSLIHRVEGEILSGLPQQSGVEITNVKFVMARVS